MSFIYPILPVVKQNDTNPPPDTRYDPVDACANYPETGQITLCGTTNQSDSDGNPIATYGFCTYTFPITPIPASALSLKLYVDTSFIITGLDAHPNDKFTITYSLDNGVTWVTLITHGLNNYARNTLSVTLDLIGPQDVSKILIKNECFSTLFGAPHNTRSNDHNLFGIYILVELPEPPIGLPNNPMTYLFLLPVIDPSKVGSDVEGNGSQQVYLGTFNSDDFNCENTSIYFSPIVDVTEGAKPTIHRVRIKYRNLGLFTLKCGVFNQQNPGVMYSNLMLNETYQVPVLRTSSGVFTRLQQIKQFGSSDANMQGLVFTDYFDVICTGESPYIYLAHDANSGPMDLISVALLGNEGEGAML